MPISTAIKSALDGSSLIRKMFEEGVRLKAVHGADKVFDFSLGNPDIDPPPIFRRMLLRLLDEGRPLPHGYMPNAGFPDVREKIAVKAGREQGVALDGSHILMSVGAAGGLNAVLKAILGPGDEVVAARPYFLEYRAYVANHDGRLVEVDAMPDFNLDVERIATALNGKTAAVLINSPHNPTGRIYPAETIGRLARVLLAHGKKTGRYPYLIADEPYREIVYDGKVVPPVLTAYHEAIVVTSYSKSLSLPGERIGYIALSPAIRDKDEVFAALAYTTRVLGYVNAPALMQRAVAALIDEKAPAAVYAKRREAFKEVLDGAGITYTDPEGAFYVFAKVPGGDDGRFVDCLKQHLILGVPGSAFGTPGWVRFAYCVDEKVIRACASAFKAAVAAFTAAA
ncbi:MAG: pyridoxal phosphate-dependent aminotransferase [Spirochaetaceae bacterium]|jgi:aspartate aminotransferase|nr:pyridoxal phosphate-dependent aminotransferase [Spirochaetaceae bacterium]